MFSIFFLCDKDGLKKFSTAVLLGAIPVLIIGLKQVVLLKPTTTVPYFSISSTFGHANLTAEYLGFSFIFQIFRLSLVSPRSWKKSIFFEVIIALTLSYIFFAWSRSVWIAVASVITILSFQKRFFSPLQALRVVLLAAICTSGIHFYRSTYGQAEKTTSDKILQEVDSLYIDEVGITQALLLQKAANTNFRTEIWKQTWQMILDQPWGVGADRFEFKFLPYRLKSNLVPTEVFLTQSPHNEFLRYAVEEGWGIACLLFSGWFFLLLKVFKVRHQSFELEKQRSLILAFFSFLFVQMLFQFPLEGPLPFYFLSAMTGLLFSHLLATESQDSAISVKRGWYVFLIPAIIIVGLLGARLVKSTSEQWMFPNDRIKLLQSCQLTPANWRVCLRSAQLDFEAGDSVSAEKTLRKIISDEPMNYPSLRLLGIVLLFQEKWDEGCRLFEDYNRLFREGQDVQSRLSRLCILHRK